MFLNKFTALINQARRDSQTILAVEAEGTEVKREKENLETILDTLKQENRNLQIEKETEVESLNDQVMMKFHLLGF